MPQWVGPGLSQVCHYSLVAMETDADAAMSAHNVEYKKFVSGCASTQGCFLVSFFSYRLKSAE